MYKVEVEDIENKISIIKKSKFTFFMMILSGLMLVASYFDIEKTLSIYFIVIFLISFIKFYFVEPLLGKIELLEEDIKLLKDKAGVEGQKHL